MSTTAGLNILFAGTPEFAAVHLEHLIASRHRVVSAYTQPDRPAGRGKKLTPSPVKQVALNAAIKVCQPLNFKDPAEVETLAAFKADIMVVVAYGLILPKAVLTTPRLGCINVHASALPRWRGAAPIQRAIEAGDSETGVTIMQMDEGLDTGDMLLLSPCPILPTDSATDLHDRLADIGPKALLHALDALAEGTQKAIPQDDTLATYAKKLTKEEALINWQLDASTLARRIRAFNPFPMAYTTLAGERLRLLEATPLHRAHEQAPGTLISANKVLTVACGENSVLEIHKLQMPGKKAMAVTDVLNGFGHWFTPGLQFGAMEPHAS